MNAHEQLVARIEHVIMVGMLHGSHPNGIAQDVVVAVKAAPQEPTFEMATAYLKLSTFEHPKDVNAIDAWQTMLNASPLKGGE